MTVETLVNYINVYGYLVIFLFLFFGIIGIPAPEESLLVLVGVLSVHHKLSLGLVVLSSVLGAFIGMQTAFACGKYLGYPFIRKFGKYVGLSNQRWEKVRIYYTKNVHKTILFGFYIPGIRQISPYFAGMNKIAFRRFFLLSLVGTVLWTVPFIVGGFYLGKLFHINPDYVPYLGIVFFLLFLLYVVIKFIIGKKRNRLNKAEK